MTTSATPPSRRRFAALIAGILLNMVFGSLYAWSVFISGLEHDLGIQRTDVSIVFSQKPSSAVTLGNFLVPFAFGRMKTAALPLFGLAFGAGGLALAATGDSYMTVIVGYGLLFGLGCGLTYNVSLQAGLRALPNNPGLANGLIISSFAAGGVLAATLLEMSVAANGVRATFWLLAISVAATGLAAMFLLAISGIHLPRQQMRNAGPASSNILLVCWPGFFLGASTGNDKMREIAAAIQEGASAYLRRQYTTIAMVGVVILVAAWFLIGIYAAIGFVIGAVLSGLAGFAGMLAGVSYGMAAGILSVRRLHLSRAGKLWPQFRRAADGVGRGRTARPHRRRLFLRSDRRLPGRAGVRLRRLHTRSVQRHAAAQNPPQRSLTGGRPSILAGCTGRGVAT